MTGQLQQADLLPKAAVVAAIAAIADEEGLLAFVETLEPEEVPVLALRARAIKAALSRLEQIADSRMVREGRDQWKDPANGALYVFSGTRTWFVSDPQALRRELLDVVNRAAGETRGLGPRVWWLQRYVHEAFEPILKVRQEALNTLQREDEECARVIREYRIPKYGPKHLRLWSPGEEQPK